MTENLRWDRRSELPDDVCAAMRDVLTEALRQAARTEDPGDGSMVFLDAEKNIGKGMWDGGWKLQSSFVEDVRMNDKPFVIVHAYHHSQVTKGSVSADVVRTPEDRRYLGQQRLDSMIRRRDDLTAAIDKLTAELDATTPVEPYTPGPRQVIAMFAMYGGGLRSRNPVGAAAIDEAVKEVERVLGQAAFDTSGDPAREDGGDDGDPTKATEAGETSGRV